MGCYVMKVFMDLEEKSKCVRTNVYLTLGYGPYSQDGTFLSQLNAGFSKKR